MVSAPVFGTAARHWSHETRRRRIRDAVTVARSQIQSNDQKIQIVANGQGSWLTGDTDVLLWSLQSSSRPPLLFDNTQPRLVVEI